APAARHSFPTRRSSDLLAGSVAPFSRHPEVRRVTRLRRMALRQDSEVPDEPIARLDAVLEEEAVAYVVVGHVVLDEQVVRAVNRHATVPRVVDRRVLDVLTLRVADQMPVDRVARERQVLTHAIELD